MFDIVVRLMGLALAAFLSRQTDTADNNYKQLYLLYLAMNDVIAKSVTANEHYLPVSWNSPFLVNTTAFHTPVEKWVFFTNSDFAELSMSVKQFLAQFRIFLQAISIRDPELDGMLKSCLHAKAIWAHRFIEILKVGSLTSNGKKLIAKSLTMGEPIEDRLYTHNIWKLADVHIAVSEFDTSSEDKRYALVEKARSDRQIMKSISGQLRAFIKKMSQSTSSFRNNRFCCIPIVSEHAS